MEKLHTRLKLLRKSKLLTQQEFAKKINISDSAYRSYELGNNGTPIKVLVDISNIMNCELDWLLKGTGPMHKQEKSQVSSPQQPYVPQSYQGQQPVSLQLVSANTKNSPAPPPQQNISIPANLLGSIPASQVFAMQVLTNNMEPQIPPGTLAIVHKQSNWDAAINSVVAVAISGQTQLYYLTFSKMHGLYTLQSFNRQYPPIHFPNHNLKPQMQGVLLFTINYWKQP